MKSIGFLAAFIMYVPMAVLSQPVLEEDVFFDPTFWKRELRLSREQVLRIHLINRDMYCALYHMADTTFKNETFAAIMQLWKTSIHDVLTQKQKKKLEHLKLRYSLKRMNTIQCLQSIKYNSRLV